MSDEDFKKQLATLELCYIALNAELIRHVAYHKAANKVLSARLESLLHLPSEQILVEIEKLGRQLHDDVLIMVENNDPRGASLLDRRDDKDLPE